MSESALLRSVVLRIRSHADFSNRQVEVEIDEFAPATVGDLYIMVIPGGIEPGPTHNKSGGVIDKIYGVDVAICIRAQAKPRDRRRELLTGFRGTTNLTVSFETHQLAIESVIDFDYTTLTTADTLTVPSSSDGFIEPLKFAGVGNIRQAPAAVFAGVDGEPAAALIRTIRFRGARRIQNR